MLCWFIPLVMLERFDAVQRDLTNTVVRIFVGAIFLQVFLQVELIWAEIYIAQLAHLVFLWRLSLVIEERLGVFKVLVAPKVIGVFMRICCSPVHVAVFLAAKVSSAGFAAGPKVHWRSQYMLMKPRFSELSITGSAKMSLRVFGMSQMSIVAQKGWSMRSTEPRHWIHCKLDTI